MMKERHTTYHLVLEAIQRGDTCPICFLKADSLRAYFGALLGECVNNPDVRATLVKSKGFCPTHYQAFEGCNDPFPSSIFLVDQARLALDFVNTLDTCATSRTRGRAVAAWKKRSTCPACRLENQAEDRYVDTLVRGLDDEPMRGAYNTSGCLCLPHFVTAMDKARDPIVHKLLVNVQRDRCSKLLRDLEEFIRKHDYRFADEKIGDEASAWRRTIEVLHGNGVAPKTDARKSRVPSPKSAHPGQ